MKKILLWTLVMIMLVVPVFAIQSENLTSFWDFENDGVDSVNGWTVSLDGALFNSTAKFGDYSLWCDGTNDHANTSGTYTPWTGYNKDSSFSVSYWAFIPDMEKDYQTMVTWTTSDNNLLTMNTNTNNRLGYFIGSGFAVSNNTFNTSGEWIHIALNHRGNVGNEELFINGVSQGTGDDTRTWSIENIEFCSINNGGGRYFLGNIDQVRIYNHTLSTTAILELYSETSVSNPTVDWSNFSNFNGTLQSVDNLSLYINLTSSNPTVNFTIYNNSISVLNVSDWNISNLYVYNITEKGEYLLQINVSDNIGSAVSKVLDVYLDVVDPVINTTTVSQSLISAKTFSFKFSDPHLFSYNISFNGVDIDSQINLNVSQYIANITLDPLDYTPGLYTLNVTVSDGHTTKEIPYWDTAYNPITKSITYKFPDRPSEDFVKIIPINAIDFASSMQTYKDTDRYKWNYSRSALERITNGNDLHFRVTSSHEIYIVHRQDYPAWMVIPDLGKWLDFDTDETVGTYNIIQIDPYTVEVEITDVVNDNIEFYSIGDVNTVTQTYQISIANISYTYLSNVFNSQTQIMNLTMDFFNISLVDNSSAILQYNNTGYNATRQITGNKHIYSTTFVTPSIDNVTNLTFNWNYSINLSDSTYQINYTNSTNQTIYPLSIDNCTNNTFKILQFFGRDEETNSLVPYDLNIDLNFTFGAVATSLTTSFEFSGQNNYSVCIPQNTTSAEYFTVNSIMEYDSDNYTAIDYTNKKYYLVNVPLNNNTHIVNHYLLDSTKASEIILQARDKNTGAKVQDAYINVLRFYPGEGISKTVEIAKTDDRGETLAKLVLADVFYTFVITKNGAIIFSSPDKQKILTTTKRFNVDLGTDILISYRDIDQVVTNVSCNKATNTCQYTWTDPTGLVSNATLEIYRFNGYGSTLLYNKTVSSSSGLISYNITEATDGNQYTAEGYLKTNTAYSGYSTGQAVLNYVKGLKDTFSTAAIIPFLWLVLGLIGLFAERGVSVVIMLLGLVVIIGSIFQIIPITIPTVIGMIVTLGIYLVKVKN